MTEELSVRPKAQRSRACRQCRERRVKVCPQAIYLNVPGLSACLAYGVDTIRSRPDWLDALLVHDADNTWRIP